MSEIKKLLYPYMRRSLIYTMKELADKEYQIRNWINKEDGRSEDLLIWGVYSCWETIDDFDYFEGPGAYMETVLFNEEEEETMRNFGVLFLKNMQKMGADKKDEEYLKEPEWDEIILEAQKAMKVLQKMEDLTKDDMYWLGSRDFLKESIQKYINPEFKSLDEFQPANLPDMIIGFLKAYGAGKFGYKMLYDLGDVLERYTGFYLSFYEKGVPKFPYRSLWYQVLEDMQGSCDVIILPEDADFFIKILQDQTTSAEELDKRKREYIRDVHREEGREERAKREVGYDREYMG